MLVTLLIRHYFRPGGTGPLGPAMAGPTFELGCNVLIKKM